MLHVLHMGSYKSREQMCFLLALAGIVQRDRVRLIYAGEGPELDRDALRRAGVGVPGYCTWDDLPECQVGLLWLCDHGPEGLVDQSRSSTKLFEYMARGLAVVCSAVGEPSEIVQSDAGFLLPNNPVEWAHALHHLDDFPEEAERLGERAQEIAGQYTHEATLRSYIGRI